MGLEIFFNEAYAKYWTEPNEEETLSQSMFKADKFKENLV